VDFQQKYMENHQGSKGLYERAARVFPSGVTHDGRFARPFPIYATDAQGVKKRDVDGREYIDYWIGHASLILGHRHPDVVKAVHRQVDRGAHYGACHELEVEWGEKVVEMVPSAERVRFTSSGTEATLLAIRLARSFTGKRKIIRFAGHYHGWHDAVCVGISPPFDLPNSSGIPEELLKLTLVFPPDDLQELEDYLKRDQDVACVILEPSGGFSGAFPVTGDYLRDLQRLTQRFGVILIFDEVITGFRYAPGGAQEYYGVTPDLSCLAKILAGGLPGGAVVGRKDIMEYLEFKDDPGWNRTKKILHYGTFNANPISAAAGLTTLNIVADGAVIPKANENAQNIRDALNTVVDRYGINWCIHGEHSIVHILMNHHCPKQATCDRSRCTYDYRLVYQKDLVLLAMFRNAMLSQGVDSAGDHWWVSWLHSGEVVRKTGEAFDRAISMLKESLSDHF
jgi:glutamate-1-semialdehyde 2,1-aminomutase